jgi:hypothetical protein
MHKLIAAGIIALVLVVGIATHKIGYYNSIPVAGTSGNAGVYAGLNDQQCVGFEFKPYTGFFVGCE